MVTDEEIEQAFTEFDHDGNGLLNENEISLIAEAMGVKMTIEEIRNMMKEFDGDRDGYINFEEFKSIMRD